MNLTEVGLEWRDGKGRERRMPYACMRVVTLSKDGKLMRISGPPGAVWLSEAHASLHAVILTHARKAECGVRIRETALPPLPGLGWLWARTGRRR